MKKHLTRVTFMILLITMLCIQTVSAELGNGLDNTLLNTVTQNNDTITSKFSNTFSNVFGTIFMILKVLGVAGIVVTGVKYMYASGNDKGQIKQSLIYIVIGTIFIFGADILVGFIEDTWMNVSPIK